MQDKSGARPKAAARTTSKQTFICAVLALAVGAAVYQARQASTLRGQVQTLRQQQAALAEQIEQLQRKLAEATRRSPSQPGATADSTGAPRLAPFDWRQVECEDYRQYIANLRAIGCPETTIKDIIVADVNELFASRTAALTQTNQYRYWRRETVSRSEEQQKQLQALYLQKQELLKALGVGTLDFTGLLSEAFRDNLEERELQLAYLPGAKQQQIKEVLFQQAQQEVADGNSVEQAGAREQAAQARIQSLLTPEEFREYELRCSTDANMLRGVLDPVGLSEPEFRAVFDSWRSLKAYSPGTAEYLAAQQSSEAALQQLLGPDRFQLYLGGVKLLGYTRQ